MDVIAAQPQLLGDVRWPDAVGQHQDNPRAHREFLERVAVGNDLRQLRALGRRQYDAKGGVKHAPRYRMARPKYREFMY